MRRRDVVEDSVINISEEKRPRSRAESAQKYERAGELRSKLRPPTKLKRSQKPESILEWFDKSVENELEKRRIESHSSGLPKSRISQLPQRSGLGHPRVVESMPSAVEVVGNLQGDIQTDLTQAVEKFAKAEAIVAFEGAVKAAEAAAASVPPELAEEAAVAGAKGYQAELTSVIRQNVPGSRPIEVIGYVGITRPTGQPIRRN